MTTVTASTSASYTFPVAANLSFALTSGQHAIVDVVKAGARLFGSRISTNQTIGPFPSGSVATITADGADLTYSVIAAVGTVSTLSSAVVGTSLAVRASQGSFGNLIDQGPAANALPVNGALFPVAWAPSGVVALNTYRTPTVGNGIIYRATAGGSNAGTEPTWGTTIGGTTVSGGVTYTAEKGPYFNDTAGSHLFRSIASSQTGAASTFALPAAALQWDMASGQSLIIRARVKFDWNVSGQSAAAPVLSNSVNGTGAGIRFRATGSTLQDLRIEVRDSLGNSVLSGNFFAGNAKAPFNGVQHDVEFMIDGVLKMAFLYVDNSPIFQSDMFNAGSLCPNGMSLAALTGSTQGGDFTIGGDPGSATSYECAFSAIDVVPLPGGLPANIQNIAAWYARAGEALLPQSLVQ